jgi:hypothetical protein
MPSSSQRIPLLVIIATSFLQTIYCDRPPAVVLCELYQQRSTRRKQEQAAKKANDAPAKDSSATNGAQDKLSTGFNSDDMGMTAERQQADDEEPESKPAAKAREIEQPWAARNA